MLHLSFHMWQHESEYFTVGYCYMFYLMCSSRHQHMVAGNCAENVDLGPFYQNRIKLHYGGKIGLCGATLVT